jgi:hypothetical protein
MERQWIVRGIYRLGVGLQEVKRQFERCRYADEGDGGR